MGLNGNLIGRFIERRTTVTYDPAEGNSYNHTRGKFDVYDTTRQLLSVGLA